MQSERVMGQRYDSRTIFFHWATAAVVVFQFVGAWTIDDFRGPLRVDARSVQITFGILLALLLVARVAWRAARGRRLPAGPAQFAAKATHWGLYAVLIVMVAVGLFLAWVRGDNFYNVFSIPAFDPGNHALRHKTQHLHATIGWIIIGLVGLHAVAALAHRYVWRDGVLARMLPEAAPR